MITFNPLSKLRESTADGVLQSSRHRPGAETHRRKTQPCQSSQTRARLALNKPRIESDRAPFAEPVVSNVELPEQCSLSPVSCSEFPMLPRNIHVTVR